MARLPKRFRPVFGWPEGCPREERRWRWFCIFGHSLSWILWRITPQPRYLLHRCEVCGKRFCPWGVYDLVDPHGTEPYVHKACNRGPGCLIPKRFVPAIEAMIAGKTISSSGDGPC